MIGLTDSDTEAALARRMWRARSGLTRLEVLVMLICLILVIMLIVPAIFHQRETQRNVACQGRIQNLGIGLLRDAQENNNRFLPLVDGGTPWTVDVLHHLEDPTAARLELTDAPIAEQPRFSLPLFLCPNGQLYQPGQNCYIVNGGWGDFETDPETKFVQETKLHTVNIDWNGDGSVSDQERQWTRSTGVIWRSEADEWSWGIRRTRCGRRTRTRPSC